MSFLRVYSSWLKADQRRNGSSTIPTDLILVKLITNEVLVKSEYQLVANRTTDEEKNVKLFVEIMPAKGTQGFNQLTEILFENKFNDLANELVALMKEISLTSKKDATVSPIDNGLHKEQDYLSRLINENVDYMANYLSDVIRIPQTDAAFNDEQDPTLNQVFRLFDQNAPPQWMEQTNYNNMQTSVPTLRTCDRCFKFISSVYYHCSFCYDFDLCAECELNGRHDEHPLVRVEYAFDKWPMLTLEYLFMDVYSSSGRRSKRNYKTVHENVICGICFLIPIKGIRYKCLVCDNFDLCAKCEKGRKHNRHPVIRIVDSTDFSYRAIFEHFQTINITEDEDEKDKDGEHKDLMSLIKFFGLKTSQLE